MSQPEKSSRRGAGTDKPHEIWVFGGGGPGEDEWLSCTCGWRYSWRHWGNCQEEQRIGMQAFERHQSLSR